MAGTKRTLRGFSNRLCEAIWSKQLTKKYVAEQIGVERKALYSYADGSTVPNAVILAKLCVVLGVSADWLLFGKEY